MFSCEFCEISKNNFFIEDPWATASEATGEEIDLKERKSTVCQIHIKRYVYYFKTIKGNILKYSQSRVKMFNI